MKVRFAPRAGRDLVAIRDYVAQDSGSAQTADRLISRLLDACDTLALLPQRHRPYRHAPEWRMMPVGRYLIFFRVEPDEVRVGHIRHSAQSPFDG